MTTISKPSTNPANSGSLHGVLREVLAKFLQGVDDMLPARVISYDRETNRATVQPLIMMVTTENERVSRAKIASVPVFQIGGGGFLLNFPLNAGDLGWIKASDRDISLFLQQYEEAEPNTLRKHSFQDALFFPHAMTGYTIAEADSGNVVLQNLSGSVKVSLGSDKITIAAPTVEIVSNTMTHNGTNIGEAHVHSGVQSGGNNTGAPV